MHSKQLADDLRSAIAQANGVPPYPVVTLAALPAEDALMGLANLFDAVDVVTDLTEEAGMDGHHPIATDRMAPVLQALSELGKRLVADLRLATAIRGLPTA